MRRAGPILILVVGVLALLVSLLPLPLPALSASGGSRVLETKLGLDLQGGLRIEYQVLPAEGKTPTRDDLNVLRFHAKESSEGRSFRWSRDTSYVQVSGIRPSSHEVTIWMNDGGRPPAAPPPEVTVFLANARLGSAIVTTGFEPYRFPIPPDLAQRLAPTGAPVQLKITVSVWVPERVLGTPDDRDLGVMVDRVAVR